LERSLTNDILNYFLSIIIPGGVNFFSIPLIKWFLGAENYGVYALWYGAFLIIVAATSGWLGISIIRFKADFDDQNFFYKHLLRIVTIIAGACAIISFLCVSWITHNILFAFIFSVGIVGCIFQNSIMAISQANFLSRFAVYSESLRMITFLCTYVILLMNGKEFYLEKLFFALILSYTGSFLFLKSKNKVSFRKMGNISNGNIKFPYKGFIQFGLPLVLWYLFSTIIPYSDKLLIAKKYGFSIQGNYQAIFDLMYRTVGVIFSPVLMATFPYLSKFYNDGEVGKVISLIRKAVLIEFAIMIACLAGYFLGGGRILLRLLDIPEKDFFYVGALILAVAFIWQMAMMLHKPFELMKKTYVLLMNNFIALIATMLPLGFIYYSNLDFIAYPTGILCGAVCYAGLCIYQVKRIIRKGNFL
jgi:O-antigen/teichoic acid export membrane protein